MVMRGRVVSWGAVSLCSVIATVIATGLMSACGSDDASGGGDSPDGAPDGGASADAATESAADAQSDAGLLEHGGSRLKRIGVTAGDGTFIPIATSGIHDTMLDTGCSFDRAQDGSFRCVPIGEASVGEWFADDQCTTLVASGPKVPCRTPKYGVYTKQITNICDTQRTAYRLGAAITPAKIYVTDPLGACVEQTPDTATTYYAIASTLAPSELVAVSESELPLTPQLRGRFISGDDGSLFQQALYGDVARAGKACTLNAAGDGKVRCTPRYLARAEGFSDMACGVPVALGSECVSPTAVFDDTTAGSTEIVTCSPFYPVKVHAFALGAKHATKEYFSPTAMGTCMGPVTTAADVFDLGAEIPASSMLEIQAGKIGASRVTESTNVQGGVTISHGGMLSDAMLGVRCTPETTSDAKVRCVPNDAPVFYFTDAACTVPVARTEADCGGTLKYAMQRVRAVDGCIGPGGAESVKVYTVGAPIVPTPPLFLGTPARCQSAGSPGPIKVYAVGPEIAPSTFAEVTPAMR